MKPDSFKYLGKGRPLVEGREKVTGTTRYVADLQLPGLFHARVILSPHAHATIDGVDAAEALKVPGVVAVLTAGDLPSRHRTITSRNSAVLAQERVLFCGQPVAVVVAESEMAAADAAELVFVDYTPHPAVTSLEAALRPDAPRVWPRGLPQEGEDLSSLHADTGESEEQKATHTFNNVFEEGHQSRGDVERGFAAADVVVEKRYHTSMLHQAYLEPHAAVAAPDPLGRGVVIYTSTQGQFTVRREVADIVGLSESDVRVEPLAMGGGFGAKYGIVEPLVAAVALAVNRPVRLTLTRSEDFLSTTPAPECIIELKTGATSEGLLTALQARVFVDNGIFSFRHGGIITLLMGGYYKCPHVQIDTYEVNTHKPQVGAYRAPGAPQATFALESNVDEMARALEMDPLEFRLRNAAESGDPMGNGRPWPPMGLKQCLERLRDHPAWQNRRPGDGTGIAIGGWPTAVTPAEAVVRIDHNGLVLLQTGHVDVSGNNSSFVLIAAETLGVRPEDVRVQAPNTDGPFAPGSGGSQVTYSVAGAVRQASERAREKLLQVAADHFEAAAEDIELADGHARVRGVPDQTVSIARLARTARTRRGGFGPITGEGTAALPENAPGFIAHLIRASVEPETGEIRLHQIVAAQDVGFALNPTLVRGQMHGGIVQGVGLGMRERMVYDQGGQLLTGSFMDYSLVRPAELPEIETLLVEVPSAHGPFGARGIGEPPIIAGAAALANAVRDATGARLTRLPLDPESVWQALRKAEGA